MCLGLYLTKILQNKWKNEIFCLFYSASLTIMHAHMIKISRLTMKCSAQKYLSFEYEFEGYIKNFLKLILRYKFITTRIFFYVLAENI